MWASFRRKRNGKSRNDSHRMTRAVARTPGPPLLPNNNVELNSNTAMEMVSAEGAEMPVSPLTFQAALGVDAQFLAALTAALTGVCAVVLLARSRPPES